MVCSFTCRIYYCQCDVKITQIYFVSTELALILSLVSSVAAQCDFSNDFQAARNSLPSRVFCGRPPITEGQNEQALLNRKISDQITGPVYEGSSDALGLGLSVENRIVDLTEAQINYYSRCGG